MNETELKARLFDTQEALQVANTNFTNLVNLTIAAIGFEGENLDQLVEALQEMAKANAEAKESDVGVET